MENEYCWRCSASPREKSFFLTPTPNPPEASRVATHQADGRWRREPRYRNHPHVRHHPGITKIRREQQPGFREAPAPDPRAVSASPPSRSLPLARPVATSAQAKTATCGLTEFPGQGTRRDASFCASGSLVQQRVPLAQLVGGASPSQPPMPSSIASRAKKKVAGLMP